MKYFKALAEDYYWYSLMCSYDGKRATYREWFLMKVEELCRIIVGLTICRWRGCKIECIYSWANPESGGEHLYCSRCHWEDHIIYY